MSDDLSEADVIAAKMPRKIVDAVQRVFEASLMFKNGPSRETAAHYAMVAQKSARSIRNAACGVVVERGDLADRLEELARIGDQTSKFLGSIDPASISADQMSDMVALRDTMVGAQARFKGQLASFTVALLEGMDMRPVASEPVS